MSEEQVDVVLSAIIDLFRCLHSRDQFMSNYLNKLAQRLLEKSYSSREAEEQMLNKLKIEHGLKEVTRMSAMFRDIGLSKEI